MLAYAVEDGTGTNAQIPGYQVAGKTGTARIPTGDGSGYLEGQYIASFIGFLPAGDPKVVVAAILDRPAAVYGGRRGAAVQAGRARRHRPARHRARRPACPCRRTPCRSDERRHAGGRRHAGDRLREPWPLPTPERSMTSSGTSPRPSSEAARTCSSRASATARTTLGPVHSSSASRGARPTVMPSRARRSRAGRESSSTAGSELDVSKSRCRTCAGPWVRSRPRSTGGRRMG